MAARNREHEGYSVFFSFFVSPVCLRSSADDVDCIIGGAGRASLQCGLWLENCSIEIENDKNNKSRRRRKEARVFTATLPERRGSSREEEKRRNELIDEANYGNVGHKSQELLYGWYELDTRHTTMNVSCHPL